MLAIPATVKSLVLEISEETFLLCKVLYLQVFLINIESGYYFYFNINFSFHIEQSSHCIETTHLIWFANQLTGFYMMLNPLILNRNLHEFRS